MLHGYWVFRCCTSFFICSNNHGCLVSIFYFLCLDIGWLVSEGLLFVSFFWTSFHSLSSPTLGLILPGEGFYLPDPCYLKPGKVGTDPRFPENGERILKVTKKSGNRGRCRKLVFLFLDRSWRVNWLINGPYLLQPRHFQDVKEDILRLYSYGLQT